MASHTAADPTKKITLIQISAMAICIQMLLITSHAVKSNAAMTTLPKSLKALSCISVCLSSKRSLYFLEILTLRLLKITKQL